MILQFIRSNVSLTHIIWYQTKGISKLQKITKHFVVGNNVFFPLFLRTMTCFIDHLKQNAYQYFVKQHVIATYQKKYHRIDKDVLSLLCNTKSSIIFLYKLPKVFANNK